MSRSSFPAFRSLFAVSFLALVAAGCGTPGTERGVSEVTAVAGTDGVERVTVEAHSFYFEPNRVIVDANHPVELTVRFRNWFAPHNLTCEHPDAGISIDVGVGPFSFGGTKHVRFTPTEAGEYGFYCNVDGHMRKGMTGTLVVR